MRAATVSIATKAVIIHMTVAAIMIPRPRRVVMWPSTIMTGRAMAIVTSIVSVTTATMARHLVPIIVSAVAMTGTTVIIAMIAMIAGTEVIATAGNKTRTHEMKLLMY